MSLCHYLGAGGSDDKVKLQVLEMAQQLRALTIPASTWKFKTIGNSSSMDQAPFSGLHRFLHACVTHNVTQMNT